jgi:hypothetical protein
VAASYEKPPVSVTAKQAPHRSGTQGLGLRAGLWLPQKAGRNPPVASTYFGEFA